MTRGILMLGALLGLCLGATPVVALPLLKCTGATDGWLSNSEIGTFVKESGHFVPSAIGPGVAAPVETALADAASFYKNTLGLTAPFKVQCVADPDTGEKRYAFIFDPNLSDFGWYHTPAPPLTGVPDLRLKPTVVNHFITTSERFVTPAHELFHAVEAGYPLFTAAGACGRICANPWVFEGMADAFAYGWMRQYQIAGRVGRVTLDRELPNLDDPLHLPADKDEAYARSHFWEYLVWEPKYVYIYKDKEGPKGQIVNLAPEAVRFDPWLLIRIMNMTTPLRVLNTPSDRKVHWEMEWLDSVLKDVLNKAIADSGTKVPRKLKGGMFVVYPKYAAWMLGHLTTGVSDAKRDAALGNMFKKGCRGLPVSTATGDAQTRTLRIFDMSTACFVIDRKQKGRANDRVDVTMEGSTDELNRIHMGWNGGVVVPSVDDGKVKTWRLGLPQGDSPSNPTGQMLWLAVSSVAENLQDTVKPDNYNVASSFLLTLKAKYVVAGP